MHQLTDEDDPLDDLDLEEGPLLNRQSFGSKDVLVTSQSQTLCTSRDAIPDVCGHAET